MIDNVTIIKYLEVESTMSLDVVYQFGYNVKLYLKMSCIPTNCFDAVFVGPFTVN